MHIIKEACVGSIKEFNLALKNQADQFEVCSHLDVGGLTPNDKFIKYVLKKTDNALMMARTQNSFYIKNDLEKLIKTIKKYVNTNIKGFVFGYLTKNNKVDKKTIKSLVDAAKNKEIVFHMAFDLIEDKIKAIDELAKLKVTRILTKGGNNKAIDNIVTLKKLNEYSKNKIQIICGGSVTKDNYLNIAKLTNIKMFHGRKLCV